MGKRELSAVARPVHYDDALITSIIRYGEANCIVKLFTREHGRIVAFMKHGFSKKRGSPQSQCLARIGLLSSQGKFARLVSCDIHPQFFMLASSLKAFGYSAYVAEIIEKILPEDDPAPEIYELIEDLFAMIISAGPQPAFLRAFELKMLNFCGYLPEMPIEEDEELINAFEPLSSLFVTTASEHSLHFSPRAIKLAKTMLIAKIGSVNYDGAELMMIGRIFQSRLKLLGLFPLKSVAFLKQISECSYGGL